MTEQLEQCSEPIQQVQQSLQEPIAGPSRAEVYEQLLQDYIQGTPAPSAPAASAPQTPQTIRPVTPAVQEKLQQEAQAQISAPTLGQVLTAIWIGGMVIMAGWFLITNALFLHRARKNAEPFACDAPVRVRISPNIPSPCLVGLFRPVIYLTPGSVQNEQTMKHVLTHEISHLRHGDHIWSWVRCICLCIYWFNPLVWTAAILSKRDCELACDESALKKLGSSERIAYGQTLLVTVSQAHSPVHILETATAMNETKKQLKERVSFIVKKPKFSIIAAICMILVCALAAGCAAGGAKSDTPSDTTGPNPTNWEISDELQAQIRQEYVGYLGDVHTCTAEDVNLIGISQVESGHVLVVGCKCSSIRLDTPWDDLWSTFYGDYEFFMPNGWYLMLYKDSTFTLLDAAVYQKIISADQLQTVWSDYYAQFPAAWDQFKQRYPDGTPNHQEEQLLMNYHNIVEFLHQYDVTDGNSTGFTDGETAQTYRSQEAIRFCYQWLKDTPEVDEWTEYCRQYWADGLECDRKTLLSHFTVLKDVKLQAIRYEEDATWGLMADGTHAWHYDNEGRLMFEELDKNDDFAMLQYIPPDYQSDGTYALYYDETGRINRIGGQYGYLTYTPNYDAAGKISSMTVQAAGVARLIQYKYDDAGRLIRVEMFGDSLASSNFLIEYSYNANGTLSRKTQSYFESDSFQDPDSIPKIRYQRIMEYQYDRNQALISATYFSKNIAEGTQTTLAQYTFSYDEQGRMVRYDIESNDEPQYVEIIYGDFLYFQP